MQNFLAFTLFASMAWGHMIMQQPVPYGVDTLNNSPLGADYPCKQRAGAYEVSEMNNIVAGTDQALTFSGTAVHGGGSCQISISTDKEPTAQSQFKVIHSIIGGCPGVDGGPGEFSFQVPKEFPNGEYALAWTWFNKIGNREMYMNCAPVTITGGSDNDSFLDSLPDMFVANIPDTECTTPEGKDIVFPEGGDSVETAPDATLETALPPACGAAAAPQPDNEAGQDLQPSVPQPTATSQLSNSQVSVQPIVTSQLSNSQLFVPAPTVSESPQVTDVISSRPFLPPPASFSTVTFSEPKFADSGLPVASQTSSAAAVNPTSPSTSGDCEVEGAVVCNSPEQFGICNHGSITWQPVAPGTSCQNGAIVKRSLLDRPHV